MTFKIFKVLYFRIFYWRKRIEYGIKYSRAEPSLTGVRVSHFARSFLSRTMRKLLVSSACLLFYWHCLKRKFLHGLQVRSNGWIGFIKIAQDHSSQLVGHTSRFKPINNLEQVIHAIPQYNHIILQIA